MAPKSVAQPVDQDAPLAIRLPHGGQKPFRLLLAQRLGERTAERLHRVPMRRPAPTARRRAVPCRPWCDRTTSGPAAATARARRARPSPRRRTPRLRPGSRSNTIRSGCSGSASLAPQACSSIAEICAMRDQAIGIVDREIRLAVRLALTDRRRQCAVAVLLEEVLAADPFRTAHDRERPPRQSGQRMLGDRIPVLRQVPLGDARPQLAIGMRQRDVAHGHAAPLRCARRSRWRCFAARRHGDHRSTLGAPTDRPAARPDGLALGFGIGRFTHHLRWRTCPRAARDTPPGAPGPSPTSWRTAPRPPAPAAPN